MTQEVQEYLNQFSGEQRVRLDTMRQITREEAPDAVESIGYGMPAYKLNGKPLIYFAAFPRHIGLYATPNGHEAFKHEFASYVQGKGSVQFPLDEPLPVDLIRRVVQYRVSQISD
ncbi:MAG: DUF1801 domain-containing protein [Candidatus Saccharimonas sp.]